MPKLFVAGCSYSDNLPSPRNYGSKLAHFMNYEYVHKAKGVGSNHRMWRHITNSVMSGELTKDDMLVVQYTTPERREFWSAIPRSKVELSADISEYYNEDGTILKFKMDSYNWQKNKVEADFMKLYQDNFLSYEYETEVFNYQHLMFQCMLSYHKIPTVFFKSRYMQEYDVITEYKDNVFTEPESFTTDYANSIDPETDKHHLNDKGHASLAFMLFNHIRSI